MQINPNHIEIAISLLLYVFLFLGIWLLFGKSILSIFVKKRFKTSFKRQKKVDPISRHIQLLLVSTVGSKSAFGVMTFYILTTVLFMLSIFLFKRQSSLGFGIVFSFFIATSPYIFLRVKLHLGRVKGSYEGDVVVAEILNQYKINYFNLMEALDKSVSYLSNVPYTQKLIVKLSLQLKTVRSESELVDILKEFVYAVDTEWIKMLSNNFYLSLQDGLDISTSLADILGELRIAKTMMEKGKRLNTESFGMVKYLTPILYVGSMIGSQNFLDFPIAKFIDYQFNTATGLKLFTVIITVHFINFVVMMLYSRRKFDF